MPDERKPKKSPYTADRSIPGAFEGETVTRRRFMTGTVHGAGAVAAAAFSLPALAFALGPVFTRQKFNWQLVGNMADFPNDTYIPRVITIVMGIGDAGRSTVYMRRRNPAFDKDKLDQYNRMIAISSRCVHVGCPVRYSEAAERFICPCHGGVYDFTGQRTSGPPVRPLDRFSTQIRNGNQVWIGPRYSVNSELRRFSARDPGQDLDGVGQYLYPARFSTPVK
jgi:menaquinol-cytochrome c reductase iron-sulfur subunit